MKHTSRELMDFVQSLRGEVRDSIVDDLTFIIYRREQLLGRLYGMLLPSGTPVDIQIDDVIEQLNTATGGLVDETNV